MVGQDGTYFRTIANHALGLLILTLPQLARYRELNNGTDYFIEFGQSQEGWGKKFEVVGKQVSSVHKLHKFAPSFGKSEEIP